jgi:hypothetical protein
MSERSTLQTILLIIGSALGGIILFVAAAGAYLYYKFFSLGPPAPGETFPRANIVLTPPPIRNDERFLGTHGVTSGGFDYDRNSVLAEGPGKLIGRITASGNDGRYEISVPYGKYRIDGYTLDSSSADAALPGKVDNPRNEHDSGVFTVAAGRDGRALDLDFLEPVKKLAPQGEVSAAQPLILSWEPYPGASEYRIQLVEQAERGSPISQKHLFNWNSQPKTAATSINLSDHGIKLRKGYYYIYQVAALDGTGRELSNSPSAWRHPDFQAVD